MATFKKKPWNDFRHDPPLLQIMGYSSHREMVRNVAHVSNEPSWVNKRHQKKRAKKAGCYVSFREEVELMQKSNEEYWRWSSYVGE